MEKLYLSTVTPVYAGSAYLRELVKELADVRDSFANDGGPVELIEAIFVDDGAIDDSAAVLTELQSQNPWVRVLTLSRNFGQHPATVAGILHTSGDWVVTLDEDLQHHPKHLRAMLARAVETHCDVLYARASGNVHQSALRDLSSSLVKSIIGRLSGNPHTRLFNSFRMMRGSVGRAAAAMTGHETYFDIALGWYTRRVESIELELKDQRYIQQRRSGYSLWALFRHARRMLVSSQMKPLRAGALVGLFAMALSSALAAWVLVLRFTHPDAIDVRGWTSLCRAILFFGGLTSFLVGILLEYISSMVLQVQGKPTFFVIDRSKDALLLDFLRRSPQR